MKNARTARTVRTRSLPTPDSRHQFAQNLAASLGVDCCPRFRRSIADPVLVEEIEYGAIFDDQTDEAHLLPGRLEDADGIYLREYDPQHMCPVVDDRTTAIALTYIGIDLETPRALRVRAAGAEMPRREKRFYRREPLVGVADDRHRRLRFENAG